MKRRDIPPRRGKEGQPCFLLEGNRNLPPPSPPSSLSQISNLRDYHSLSVTPFPSPSRTPYQHTKTSRLRASSAPVRRPQPDYARMARRRKESILAEKTISPAQLQNQQVPKGESFHSFLVGGRYNSTKYIDVRPLERLGVYVPRNPAVKTFINPPGGIPPSPAVYGLNPLKTRTAAVVVVDKAAPHSTDKGLSVVQRDLDPQVNKEIAQYQKHNPLYIELKVLPGREGTETESGVDLPTKTEEYQKVFEKNESEFSLMRKKRDENSSSSISNLLSPEARLLTQEILLETNLLRKEDDISGGKHHEPLPSSRHHTSSSAPLLPHRLRAKSVTYLPHPHHGILDTQTPSKRPRSALQSSDHDQHTQNTIFIDLSKLNTSSKNSDKKHF